MKIIKYILFILLLIGTVYKSVHTPSFIDQTIGGVPVMHDGRVKPFDTVARHYLLQIQGRQQLDGYSPTDWLFGLITHTRDYNDLPIILVEHPNLFDSIDSKYNKQKFRISEGFLDEHLDVIQPFVTAAVELDKSARTHFLQSAYLVFYRYSLIKDLSDSFFPDYLGSPLGFWNQMLSLSKSFDEDVNVSSAEFVEFTGYYTELEAFSKHPFSLYLVMNDSDWLSLSNVALNDQQSRLQQDYLSNYLLLSDAYQLKDLPLIEKYSQNILMMYQSQVSKFDFFILRLEYYFNLINPFIVSLFLYLLLVGFSFYGSFFNGQLCHLFIRHTWLLALFFHTFGMVCRSLILMRPPIINLYSSATFIAFCVSLIGFFIYKRSKLYFYSGYIGALSALSLIVAYHLSLAGDTLGVMEAVLNSNFWLATHVVSMTIGYAILFMAGFFAISYILIGTLTNKLTSEFEQKLVKLVYIFLMIALFFNFLGTILGGIWADQSWGRFWGWDPKENGAILIVLWIAIILHMKWGRLIMNRGLMLLTVFANIVCAWSWKGTNMLGIGLHSYGFTDTTFYWLLIFIISQLIIICFGMLPRKYWNSFKSD